MNQAENDGGDNPRQEHGSFTTKRAEVEPFGDVFQLVAAEYEFLVGAHQYELDQEQEEDCGEWERKEREKQAFDRDPPHGQLKNKDSAHKKAAEYQAKEQVSAPLCVPGNAVIAKIAAIQQFGRDECNDDIYQAGENQSD